MNNTNITPFVFILFFTSIGNAAFAESEDEKLDSYYASQFEEFNKAFEEHIRQLDKCIAKMEIFENKDTELVFNDVECPKLYKMRPEAQVLYEKTRAVLEEYHRWISSLTEKTFTELVKYSIHSQSILLASTREYLTRHKMALLQTERVMQKQVRRLEEMEQRIKEAEQQIESNQGEENSRAGSKSN